MYVCIHPSIHPSILLFAYFFGGSTKIRDFTSKSLGETLVWTVWTNQVTKSGKVTTRNSGIYVTVHGDRGMGQYLWDRRHGGLNIQFVQFFLWAER
jgi:hypothetical protein